MSVTKLSFSDWVYPTKHQKDSVTAWSANGLFAHAIGDVLTVYVPERGGMAPLISWKPFEHPITAMAWYDGTMFPNRGVAVIVIASSSGRVSVFDLSAKKNVASFKISKEYATCIRWSSFSPRTFYVGTAAGELICCDMVLDRLVSFSQKWTLKIGFPIEFISIEPNCGDSLALACGAGNIMFVENLNNPKPTLLGNSLAMCDKGKNTISAMEYFHGHPDFVIFVTKLGTILYSIRDEVSIPLLQEPNLRAVYQVSVAGNLMISVRDDAVDLYEFGDDIVKIQELYLGNHSAKKMQMTREIGACHYSNNRLLLLTTSWVLLTVELRGRKMFISGYERMLDAKPLDWSLWRGGMAIVTDGGKLLVTRMSNLMTPLAPSPTTRQRRSLQKVQKPEVKPAAPPIPTPPVGDLNDSRRRTRRPAFNAQEPAPESEANSCAIPSMSDGPHVEFKVPSCPPLPETNVPKSGSVSSVALPKMIMDQVPLTQLQLIRQRRKSATDQKIADQTMQTLMELAKERKIMEAPTELISQMEKGKEKAVVEYGNSRAFMWYFNVCSGALQHVEWISASKVLVWGTETLPNNTTRNHAYLVDCRNRKLTSLLNKQVEALNVPITSVTVSENKHSICLILNHKIATVMALTPEVRQIGSFPFSTKVVCAFSPTGDKIVFLDHKGGMRFTKFIDTKKSTPVSLETSTAKTVEFKKDVPTCMIWRVGKDMAHVLVVGTMSGNVLKIDIATGAVSTMTVLKNKVDRMIKYGKGMVLVDEKGSISLMGVQLEWQFPSCVKNITCVSPTTFLIRGSGEGRIRAIQNSGKFLPLYSPVCAKSPLMKSRESWANGVKEISPGSFQEAIRMAGAHGMNLVRLVLESSCYPNVEKEQMTLLANLSKDQPVLGSLAMRISLLTGDRERARQLCLSGLGQDPVISILKATLFESVPNKEYVEAASAKLMARGEVGHALDIWMILNDWNTAIEMLVKREDLKNTATVLSALEQDEESITQSVARKFIAHSSTGVGLRLLGRAKCYGDIVNIFQDHGETEQAAFVRMCSQLQDTGKS